VHLSDIAACVWSKKPTTGYRASPNEATSRSMVDPLRRNDFIYGVVVTPFDEVL
jgi:hypothetical protein